MAVIYVDRAKRKQHGSGSQLIVTNVSSLSYLRAILDGDILKYRTKGNALFLNFQTFLNIQNFYKYFKFVNFTQCSKFFKILPIFFNFGRFYKFFKNILSSSECSKFF